MLPGVIDQSAGISFALSFANRYDQLGAGEKALKVA
jgi:hypothetical protein